MKIGIIIPQNQYAILEDEQEFHHLSPTDDSLNIPNDIILFSNLNKENLWKYPLFQKYNIKDSHFFNLHFNTFEKIVKTENDTSKTIYLKMMFIFKKILLLGQQYYSAQYDRNKSSFSYAIQEKILNPIEYNDELKEIFPYLYQQMCPVMNENNYHIFTEKKYPIITLKKNGWDYAENLLNQPNIPNIKAPLDYVIYSQQYIKENFCENTPKASAEKFIIENITSPYIVKLKKREIFSYYKSIENILDETTKTYSFDNHIERIWLIDSEFQTLSNFYHLEIEKILIFNQTQNIDHLLEDYPLQLPTLYSLNYFSLISTLFIENVILSLQERQRTTKYIDLLGLFLSAFNRQELLLIVLLLHNKGFHVINYGKNQINLFMNNDKINLLKEIVQKYNYIIYEQ